MGVDVTVETPCRAAIGREGRKSDVKWWPAEMNAVVAQEHPVAVRRVAVSDQVRCLCDCDIHRPADLGEVARKPLRHALACSASIPKLSRSTSDVRATAMPEATDPYT
jgi:hypothetical protein